MDWQVASAAAVILAAAAYLVWRAARSWNRSRSGCGSCSSAAAPSPGSRAGEAFIPADQLTFKSRNSKPCDK